MDRELVVGEDSDRDIAGELRLIVLESGKNGIS